MPEIDDRERSEDSYWQDAWRDWIDCAQHLPTVINHVVVHSGDLVSALIGGGIVLLGVFVGEVFVRLRERRRRLDEAAWELQSATRGGLLVGRLSEMTPSEASSRYAHVLHQLGRIRAEAKWPIRDANVDIDPVVATVRPASESKALVVVEIERPTRRA